MIDIQVQSEEKVIIDTDQKEIQFAILADTHVPDRVNCLHPDLIPLIQQEKIDAILHCGDVIEPTIIDQLSEIAPVVTVLGNRDAFFSKATFPFKVGIQVFQKKIGLYHGFLSIRHYFPDKLSYIFQGYHFEKYFKIGQQLFPDVDVLCFGHTHTAEIRRYSNQLAINPGTAGPRSMNGGSSFAKLRIQRNGKMHAHFIPLDGYKSKNKVWVKSI